MVVDEPLYPALEAGQLVDDLGLERLNGEQRDQPHQRAHLDSGVLAVGVEHVVKESVLLVPQAQALAAEIVHSVGDVDEVLEELRRDILVGGVVPRQLQRDRQHVEAVHPHPRRAVGLLEVAARRERRRTIEDTDVVEAKEAALEDVLALGVLAIDPPREVEEQLVEHLLQELAIALSTPPALDPVDAERRPRVHGRVDVAERPLVGGDLAVRMHVPLDRKSTRLNSSHGYISYAVFCLKKKK